MGVKVAPARLPSKRPVPAGAPKAGLPSRCALAKSPGESYD